MSIRTEKKLIRRRNADITKEFHRLIFCLPRHSVIANETKMTVSNESRMKIPLHGPKNLVWVNKQGIKKKPRIWVISTY